MSTWPPLPDEDDPRWEADADDEGVWAQLRRVLAAADAAGTHHWRRVAIEVFNHAASWDVYGAMQSIRHGPEKAFCPDEVPLMAAGLEPLTLSRRAGTRFWVAGELGILREISSLPWLLQLLSDPREDVAEQAQDSVDMLAHVHPEARRHESLQGRASRTKAR